MATINEMKKAQDNFLEELTVLLAKHKAKIQILNEGRGTWQDSYMNVSISLGEGKGTSVELGAEFS